MQQNNPRLIVQVTRVVGGGAGATATTKNAPLRSSTTTPFVSEDKLVDQSIAKMMQLLHGSGSGSSVGRPEMSTKKNAINSILSTSNHSKSGGDNRDKKKRSKKQRSERRIRFSKYDAVYDIKHINDFTDQEIQDCYMNPNELKAIRMECRVAVKEYDGKGKDGNKEHVEKEGYYLRGLDQHTNKYRERKDDIAKQVYDAVFRIQDFAWNSGVDDCTDMIAKASMKYSEPSVIAAQMAAMSDLFSSFKGTWTQRHIPTIESKPTNCKITMA